MKVVIMCGIPGSGKTSWARKVYPDALICSADHWFEQNGGFNVQKLGEAHGACLRQFTDALIHHAQVADDTLIVDNTNTTTEEMAPYISLAMAYGAEIDIVTVMCSPELGSERNVHEVGDAACAVMAARLARRKFPSFWKVNTVTVVL